MQNQADLILLAAGVVVTWTAFHQRVQKRKWSFWNFRDGLKMLLLCVSTTSGVQSVCAGWQLGLLVENLNKSVPNPGEQGHEETFPSDGISFACSSINVCIIPFKGKVSNVYFWVSLPNISMLLPTRNKGLVDSGFGLDADSARDWFEDERFRLRFSRGAAVLQLLSKGAGWDLVNSCKCWIVFVPQFPFWKWEIG